MSLQTWKLWQRPTLTQGDTAWHRNRMKKVLEETTPQDLWSDRCDIDVLSGDIRYKRSRCRLPWPAWTTKVLVSLRGNFWCRWRASSRRGEDSPSGPSGPSARKKNIKSLSFCRHLSIESVWELCCLLFDQRLQRVKLCKTDWYWEDSPEDHTTQAEWLLRSAAQVFNANMAPEAWENKASFPLHPLSSALQRCNLGRFLDDSDNDPSLFMVQAWVAWTPAAMVAGL